MFAINGAIKACSREKIHLGGEWECCSKDFGKEIPVKI